MQQTNSENKISRSLIFKWHNRFSDGRENVKDDKRCGRNKIINAGIIDDVKTCFDTVDVNIILECAAVAHMYLLQN